MPIELFWNFTYKISPTITISHTSVPTEKNLSMPPTLHTLNGCCYWEPTLHKYEFWTTAIEREVRFYRISPGRGFRRRVDPHT